MPYRYLEDIAIADAAFEAWGDTVEAMLTSAANATVNIMVSDLSTVRPSEHRQMHVEEEQLDMLLFQLLQELIYYKDAEQLLLLVQNVRLEKNQAGWSASVDAAGEKLNPQRHELVVDIKAITLHRLCVQRTSDGWRVTVTVDV